MTPTTWVWTSPTWPKFTYDLERLAAPLRLARSEWGTLFGKAEVIGADDLAHVQRDVWSGEAVATAAIEGEALDLASVRSSVARRLGINPTFTPPIPRNVEGLLDVMQSATSEWDTELTDDRLCRWQAALFPGGEFTLRTIAVGRYRDTPMQIVSGPIGKEVVHYEAPPAAAVRPEMRNFLDWFNRTRESSLDGILRAGIAHVWFESIHPFEDGNGRVGRAIVDMALAQDARRQTWLHGVSSELRRRQQQYYSSLNDAQRGTGDLTAWLEWFVQVFADSCASSAVLVDEALVRASFWSKYRHVDLNERQRKVLNKLLEAGPGRFEGGLTQSKYVRMTGVSPATAKRDLSSLVKAGMLDLVEASRSSHYNLAIPGWAWVPAQHQGTGN